MSAAEKLFPTTHSERDNRGTARESFHYRQWQVIGPRRMNIDIRRAVCQSFSSFVIHSAQGDDADTRGNFRRVSRAKGQQCYRPRFTKRAQE